jgi:hypothetical protein
MNDIDTITECLKANAAKVADHLRQQAALRADLRQAAEDSEAAGCPDYASIFQELAARLGPANPVAAKDSPASRRRGRPPKPADTPPTLE